MSSSKLTQQAFAQSITAYEKFAVFPTVVSTVAYTIASPLTQFTAAKKPPKHMKHVVYTGFRKFAAKLTDKQFQFLLPPTEDVYRQLCEVKAERPESAVLDDGTTAYWLGPSSADHVILNFHGGGYVLPGNPEQFKFLWQIQEQLQKKGKSVSILYLDYDLAPSAHYPRQLQQAAAMLSHIITKMDKNPSKIILMGDSAGGNLALALLSHLSHPHPSTTAVTLSSKLQAVVLISPQVSFDTDTPSFTTNAFADLIAVETLIKWGSSFMGTSSRDNYNEAESAPLEWWNDLKVNEIMIVKGSDELLLDSTSSFAKKIKQAHGKVTDIEIEGEPHNACNIDAGMGYGNGVMGVMVQKWIAARF